MITPIEYVNGALRTEAPVTDEMLERFREHRLTQELFGAFQAAIASGKRLDALKKALFYNKNLAIAEGHAIDQGTADEAITPGVIRLIHAAIGLNTESGEVIEALADHIFGGMELDHINLIEEGGDQFWYMAIYADALSVTFADMMDRNNRKLRARYGAKFTEAAAMTRNLDAEQTELSHSNAESTNLDEAYEALLQDDAPIAGQLLTILSDHCGESGESEGAVETLLRIISERDKAREQLEEGPGREE